MISKFNFPLGFTFLCFLIPLLLLPACSTDEEEMKEEEILEKLSQEEVDFMTKILTVEDNMTNVWNGYNCLKEYPIFIITEANNGIFINPPSSQLANSRQIENQLEGFDNLALYRNDEILEFAKMELSNIPINYYFANYQDFSLFVYQLSDLSDNFYTNYKNRNGHFHVSVFFHELFHVFASIKNQEQYFDVLREQNLLEYPVTPETLPLLMLLFDLMIDAYHQDSNSQKTKFLQYYVTIQHQLNQIDPSVNNLIRNHGFYQEKSEGAARYIEVFSTLNTLDNNTTEDPTHGFKEFSNNLTTNLEVRQIYAFRIFYHTGAGAIHLLKELGFPNLEASFLTPTNTPYDLAESFLDMTDVEKSNALEEDKMLYNWDLLTVRSEILLDLP